ncbi:MAG: hypothetical protein WD049_05455 [Candidatus Paceibacterota bacterium]
MHQREAVAEGHELRLGGQFIIPYTVASASSRRLSGHCYRWRTSALKTMFRHSILKIPGSVRIDVPHDVERSATTKVILIGGILTVSVFTEVILRRFEMSLGVVGYGVSGTKHEPVNVQKPGMRRWYLSKLFNFGIYKTSRVLKWFIRHKGIGRRSIVFEVRDMFSNDGVIQVCQTTCAPNIRCA